MACKGARLRQTQKTEEVINVAKTEKETKTESPEKLYFGVDSKIQADDILQNNITEFEWVWRNKIYPSFWGRNIVGEDCLTKEEIDFLHGKACKIAAIYNTAEEKETEEQGIMDAKKVDIVALELGIPQGVAIFLEVEDEEDITTSYMRGFAKGLIKEGYIPAFKANTDAKFDFDREFSRGMQTDKDIFSKCLVWAVAPNLVEYDKVTTTHLIHPDNWMPYAPSGITRDDIAVWQYGKDCHPINDDNGKATAFNINLVKDDNLIIDKMF